MAVAQRQSRGPIPDLAGPYVGGSIPPRYTKASSRRGVIQITLARAMEKR